jgi:hypothetical protein
MKPYIDDYIRVCLPQKYGEFIRRQQKWYADQPWLQINGSTPEQAVLILKELGW